MKLSAHLFSVFSLSLGLGLTACSTGLPSDLNTGTLQTISAGQRLSQVPTETLQVRFAQGNTQGHAQSQSFRTQMASFSQMAFLRISVVGQGISTAIQSDWIAVNNQVLSASLSGVPQSEGQLRVVTVQAYDADKNPLPAFESKAIYTSSTSVSTQNLTVSRRYFLLGKILENLLSNDTARLAQLDRTALQTKLEGMTGYVAASQTFGTDPSRYNPQALVDQIAADGSTPDANALSSAALRQTSSANLTVNTANKKPLAEAVRLLVSDPSSKWADVASLTASGVTSTLAGVAPGTWSVEAQNMSGTRVGTGSLTIDGAGTTANASLDLSNVSLGKGEFQVNTSVFFSQSAPRIGIDNSGNFTLVWRDENAPGIYARRYNSTGEAQTGEFRVNTHSSLVREEPDIAMNATGNCVFVWQSFAQDGSNFGVYAKIYNAAGESQGDEFRVNTTTEKSQRSPSVAVDSNGNFVVVWQSLDQDGSGAGIYAQRYNAAGAAQGGEFLVNTTTANDQINPSVAFDNTGNFVVVWESNLQDGSGYGVYAQRFNAVGEAQGAEFRVNTTTSNDQNNSSLSIDSSGNSVITWSSMGQDGNDKGIYAQRFNAAGVAQGNEFRVNTYTLSYQDGSRVSMLANGDFVVAWLSSGQDGSNNGIYAQRFNAAGVAQGNEFRVNTYTNNHQSNPALAFNSQGQGVVTWDSEGQDHNSGLGVFAQLLNAQGGFL